MVSQALTVERRRWDAQAAAALRETLNGDGPIIRAMVESGEARLWHIQPGPLWMITRREGPELVIMCLAGAGLMQAAPLIIAAARRAGCTSIRFHTRRPALGRYLRRFGFTETERVFSMGCGDGRQK